MLCWDLDNIYFGSLESAGFPGEQFSYRLSGSADVPFVDASQLHYLCMGCTVAITLSGLCVGTWDNTQTLPRMVVFVWECVERLVNVTFVCLARDVGGICTTDTIDCGPIVRS